MDQTIEKKIDELLAKMTVAEKVGQLNQQDSIGRRDRDTNEDVRAGKIGSFILSGLGSYHYDCEGAKKNRDFLNEAQRVAVEESRLGIPIIFGHDVIHGHHTMFPDPLALAAGFNPDMVEKSYRCIAKEAANDGIHWSFAPMVDMSHDPRWGRCVEGPGEDPYLGSKMAAAAVRGFQGDDLSKRDSVGACAKHFVGYGAAEGGRDYHTGEISDYTLRNFYLPNFRAAVDAGCVTVMNAFNDIAGQPMASNRYLLTDVLRGEMGFEGFVVSDDNAVRQLLKHGVAEDEADCAQLALNAGIELDMRDDVYINNLEKCVEDGTVSMETLDEAVRRVLRVKFLLGLFENPYIECVPVDYEEHSRVARAMADESVVLLKNNGILPLSKDMSVGLVGHMQTDKALGAGCWACDPDMDRITTLNDAMREAAPDSPISFHGSSYADIDSAFALYKDVLVVCLGQHPIMDGESANVTSLELCDDQKALIERLRRNGIKMVAVIRSGRPLALESVEHCFDAIVWGWHGGTEGARSIASILYGEVNPSGRLPISLPRVTGQVPLYYNQTSSCRPNEGYYGDGGFKNYRDSLGTPMYPFGYGLSYTKFEYSDVHAVRESISLGEIMDGGAFEIRVKVKNIGDREGKEVAQCYIHDCVARLVRPVREMKGFDKSSYAPGEEKEITFRLTKDELGYWNDCKQYVVEPGKFKVWVGPDCYAKDEIVIEITK